MCVGLWCENRTTNKGFTDFIGDIVGMHPGNVFVKGMYLFCIAIQGINGIAIRSPDSIKSQQHFYEDNA